MHNDDGGADVRVVTGGDGGGGDGAGSDGAGSGGGVSDGEGSDGSGAADGAGVGQALECGFYYCTSLTGCKMRQSRETPKTREEERREREKADENTSIHTYEHMCVYIVIGEFLVNLI